MYKFKLSIIMSIYSTDEWLHEAVDSVLAQDIGFEENVQIIFVNDGSPDDSEEICLEYQKQYPHNIVYIKKKNGGLASARNAGLQYRDGELINFFDPDDILTPTTLSGVYKFYQSHGKENLALIAIPLMFFEAKTGYHPKYPLLGEKDRVIDVDEEPYNFILSSASSFYPARTFDGRSFNEDIFGAEDSDLNLRILKDNRKIGYVVEGGVEYKYRQRLAADSIMGQARANPASYLSAAAVYTALLDTFTKEGSTIPRYFKEALIYDLRGRIASYEKEIFIGDQYKKLRNDYIRLASILTKEDIEGSPFAKSDTIKLLFFTKALTERVTGISPAGTVLVDTEDTGVPLKFFAKNIELTDDKVIVEGVFHAYLLKGISLCLEADSGNIVKPKQVVAVTSSHDERAGTKILSETIYVRFEVPYASAKYAIVATGKDIEGGKTPVLSTIFQYSPFVFNSRHIRLWRNGFAIRFYNNRLSVVDEPRRSMYNHLKATLAVFKRGKDIKVLAVRLLLKRKNKAILICDRPGIARDNGEAIFRYINENEPGIAKNTYFVINKESPDVGRLKAIGRVVYRGSFKHKFVYLNSKLQMSSHLYLQFLSPFSRRDYKNYADMVRRKFVWLQHGITMNDISGAGNRFHQGVDGVVIAARPEQKIFSEKRYFYTDDQLLTSGFPRFDYNDNRTDGTITIMPTWRKYITSQINEAGLHEKVQAFEHTEFYEKYADLLQDRTLRAKLAMHPECKIQFVLHPGLMNQRESFEKLTATNISIVTPGDTDYRRIFSQSSLVITDYSSIFWDVSYMYKPVVFYQFDQEKFFAKHYKKSEYFNYEKDGTGPVLTEHDTLIGFIIDQINSGFELHKKYKKRIDKMFLHHDKYNSKRLVEALKKREYL
ncbi:MAG TPA: CDP-glycerol glycerophosphotransferase family protein [Candidatus Saccharibacteria bacterium]|nr:CDP-glycerol glycerophosphotransferase family protein [Candidatus Saccharibacteria bacterium]